ncbi:MAG: hypothetical protein IH845_03550, partial [Nanoarchaeota archaeon]|nr:hypothetical protein [Nanoarchaeota archaeon]
SREEEFTPILNPSDNRLRVRFPCGDCNYSDKHAVKLEAVGNITPQIGVFNSTCFEHGEYRTIITPDNSEYVDSNTLVRNVMKEATISKDSISEGFLPIVVKGGDWIHSSVLVSTALEMLGYGPQKRPDRIYTPLIEDWSGAKFSKSLYLEADSYDSFPAGFVSLADFERTFGEEGIRKLADHVATWVEDPKKLYRNYSLEYLIELFKK